LSVGSSFHMASVSRAAEEQTTALLLPVLYDLGQPRAGGARLKEQQRRYLVLPHIISSSTLLLKSRGLKNSKAASGIYFSHSRMRENETETLNAGMGLRPHQVGMNTVTCKSLCKSSCLTLDSVCKHFNYVFISLRQICFGGYSCLGHRPN
jgi:hypothetical protein